MSRREVRFSTQFDRALSSLIESGQLHLLRAQALEDAIDELATNPMFNDGVTLDSQTLHWVKICRATGRIDTGLRVLYLLTDDGAVLADDLALKT